MCNGQIKRSQRLPKNPLNGQIPAWNSASNVWEAVNNSLPDGTNADDILLWDAIGLTWYSSTSPFTNRDLNEAINGQWDFRNAATFTGGIIDPFGVSSPSSGYTTGADIDGHLFYKNSLGAIITFRTASVSSDVIYDLPTVTGTLALRGKTGIHFDADANVSASLQVLKDPANNSLPIQVSSSQIGMAFSGVTNPIIWRANSSLPDYSGWHQADGTYRFLTKDGAALFINNGNGINIQNGLGSGGRTSIDANGNWNIGGSFSNGARLHIKGDGTNPIVKFESGAGVARFTLDNDGIASFTNTVKATDIDLSGGQRAISSSTGYILLTTNYLGTFTGLRFGGTGVGNPMIKRVGDSLEVVTANDVGTYANFACAIFSSISGRVNMSAAGSFGIRSGAGSPEGVIIATPGSIYLRTDGDAMTSLYVKGSGTGNTGWVAK